MHDLPTARKLELVALARAKWLEVPPSQVFPDLMDWADWVTDECNSIACFGGHVALWPEFTALGVVRSSDGAPYMNVEGYKNAAYAAFYLFGDYSMFTCRLGHPADHENLTDHEIVLARLDSAEAELRRKLCQES